MENLISTLTLVQLTVTCVLSPTCRDEEYELPDRCCPKCPAGTQVSLDCIPDYNTTQCKPCDEGTFMDESTSRTLCYTCTVQTCEGPGLRLQSCRVSSDSVCEPQEGFFCVKSEGDNCVSAQTHSVCEPGQHVLHQGTASSDTVCSSCTNGTFSNGTSSYCQPHTLCEKLNKVTVKAGNSSSDAVCAEKRSRIGLLISFLFLLLVYIVICCICENALSVKQPVH